MAFCTGCGAPRKGDAAFCTGCGRRFEAEVPTGAERAAATWGPVEEPLSSPRRDPLDPASSFGVEAPPDDPEVPPVPLFSPGETVASDTGEGQEMLVPWLSEPPDEPVPATGEEPTVESPVVAARDLPGGSPLASYLMSGWREALTAAAVAVFLPLVVSIAYGAVLAFAASRDVGRIADGASAGAALVFAAFGSRVGAIDTETSSLGYLLQSPALSWMALGLLATRQGVRAGLGGMERSRPLALALVAKVTVLCAVAMAALAALLPPGLRGLPAGWAVDTFLVSWEPVAVSAVVVTAAGLWALARQGAIAPASPARPRLRWAMKAAAAGARAYGLLLLLMIPLVILAGALLGLSVDDLPPVLASAVVTGGTLVTLASVVAMGGVVEAGGGTLGVLRDSLPPAMGGGEAPPLLLLLVLTVPAVVAWKGWRVLALSKPRDRVTALATGAGLGAGFTLAAWVAMFLARRALFGGIADDLQASLVASPGLLRAMALALAWGMVGGLLPALVRRIEPVRPTARRPVDPPKAAETQPGSARYQRS